MNDDPKPEQEGGAGPSGEPPPQHQQESAAEGGEPSEEELRRRIEEQLRKVRVQDLLLESVVSVINLAARRIAKEDERDLEQARVGIEAVRALVDLLDPEPAGQVRSALSEVQMLYAREAGGGEEPGGGEQPDGPPGEQPEGPPGGEKPPPASGPGRGPSKLWTPPGT
jgi:hypothetical protein